MRKYYTKVRQKPWAKPQLCISISDDKTPFRYPTAYSFVNCNILCFLGWLLYIIVALLSRYRTTSGILNILKIPKQPKIHLHNFMQWPSRPLFRDTPDTCLASESFFNHREQFHSLFLLCLAPESYGKVPSLVPYWVWNMVLSFNYIVTNFLFSMASFTA